MPLPLTVSCFSKIQIGFAFLVPVHLGSPGKRPLNGCVCVCVVTKTSSIRSSVSLDARLVTDRQIDVASTRASKSSCG